MVKQQKATQKGQSTHIIVCSSLGVKKFFIPRSIMSSGQSPVKPFWCDMALSNSVF